MTAELPVQDSFGCTVQGFENPEVHERIDATGQSACAGQEKTTPGYFASMGIPVVEGRDFTAGDVDNPSRGAVIVTRAFAEKFWPGENPIGKGVAPSGRRTAPFYHVVGVVGDTPAGSLDGDPAIAIHYPIRQNNPEQRNWGWWRPTTMNLVVKVAAGDPLSVFPQVRRSVAEVDGSIPLTMVRTMDEIVAESASRVAFISLLLVTAATVAVILAIVGIYGVVSYVVSRSTREIGLRMAIGARPVDIVGFFLKRSFLLIAAGTIVGSGVALGLTKLLEGMLYGVESSDPAVYLSAAGLMIMVALLATLIPTVRAAGIEPVEALRTE